jgi:hypothetical protein
MGVEGVFVFRSALQGGRFRPRFIQTSASHSHSRFPFRRVDAETFINLSDSYGPTLTAKIAAYRDLGALPSRIRYSHDASRVSGHWPKDIGYE